jgi:site-specific DNA recombinase
MNKLAAIYARVSSDRQKEDKTIGSQTSNLLEYAQTHEWTVPKEWIFEDEGYSGAILARPGLERLRDLVAEGQVQGVLVYGPDRLSRKYAYQVLLLEEFSRQGVETVFLQGVSAQTPEERLLVQFQGMIAEYERAQIAERCRRGKRYRAKTGCVNILSSAPYGYRYVKKAEGTDACYLVEQTEAGVVREVFQWYTVEGLSIGAIARRLNEQKVATRFGQSLWERSKVWAMLRNPAYVGRAAFGKTERAERKRVTRPLRQKGGYSARSSANRERPQEQWISVPVPALVSEETFARAREKLAENLRFAPRNTKQPTLLQGLVVCGQCGYGLYRTSTKTTRQQARYYRCLGSDGYRHLRQPPCPCKPIRVEDLDEAVWKQVIDLLEKPELIQAELDRRRQEKLRTAPTELRRGELQQSLKRTELQIDKLLDAYQEGLVELQQLRHRMPELRRKQQTVQKELESAQWEALLTEKTHHWEQSLTDFTGRLRQSAQTLNITERQKVIRLLIKDIVVEVDNRITIRHCLPLIGGVRDAHGSKLDCYLLGKGSRNPALRCARKGGKPDSCFQVTSLQPFSEHLCIHWDMLEHPGMADLIETAFDIAFQNPFRRVRLAQHVEALLNGVSGGTFWAEAIGMMVCQGFSNRFQPLQV